MGIYVGWTAHEDSFAERQMRAGREGSTFLAFSGECFATDDAGVDSVDLIERYEKGGDGFVRQLNGLFSGLLVDQRRQRALLFNDRYGLERIYVAEVHGDIFFASEAKALLQILASIRAFHDEAVAQFLAFGCTVGRQTLFQGVELLEGGTLWIIEKRRRRKQRYFHVQEWESQDSLSSEAFETHFERLFRSVLPRYIGNDRNVGISLTGGLDTRMIMACLSFSEDGPPCYTFSGLQEDTRDERVAARVAQACGLDHQILRIRTDFLSQYGDYVDRTVFVTDGCSGALGAHE
jgi:asparagine synthase (glutamine-hydrolysing)